MIAPIELIFANLVGGKGAGKSTILRELILLALAAYNRHMNRAELMRLMRLLIEVMRMRHPPHVKIIRRGTERDPRLGEEFSLEYEFFPSEEFRRLMTNGKDGYDVEIAPAGTTISLYRDENEGDLESVLVGDSSPDILPGSLRTVSDNGRQRLSGMFHPRNYPDPDPDPDGTLFYAGVLADSTPFALTWIKQYFPNIKSFFITVEREEMRRRLERRNAELGLTFEDQWAINETYFASHPEEGCIVVSNNGTPDKCAKEIARIAELPLPTWVLR